MVWQRALLYFSGVSFALETYTWCCSGVVESVSCSVGCVVTWSGKYPSPWDTPVLLMPGGTHAHSVLRFAVCLQVQGPALGGGGVWALHGGAEDLLSHQERQDQPQRLFFLPSLSIFLMGGNSRVVHHIPLCGWIRLGSKPVFELKIVSWLLYFSSSALFYPLAGSARRHKGKFGDSNWIISVVSSNGMIYSKLSVGRKSDMMSQGQSLC